MRKSHVFILFLGLQLFLASSFAINIDKIIVFGDSLSDTGNLYNFTVQAKKVIPIFPLIPREPPYFHGRFSNGPVWVETVANVMNVPLVNYAYAGSWAESIADSGPFVPFNLGTQVDAYLVNALTDFHKDKHLYVIWSGANDYIHGRFNADGTPSYEYPTTNTVKVIKTQIDWLIYYGAKNFLVIGLPNLGYIPLIIKKGPEFVQMEMELSKKHNSKLQEMLANERKANPTAKIISINIEDYFADAISDPEKYHLKNVTDPCYDGSFIFKLSQAENNPEVAAAKKMKLDIVNNDSLWVAYENSSLVNKAYKICDNPNEYLFWDKLHPTTIVHNAIAKIALKVLNAQNIYN